ncbi:MAG: class I SAM-dependent methyltransferase [Dechloromonas sp.]|nr:class I SAM-dependent methyltransferase [Dechloromonas sp.]
MGLQHSYALIAPFYDLVIARATHRARLRSLSALPAEPSRVLLAGIGTGLDLPLLPGGHRYVGLDLTASMLRRSLPRMGAHDYRAVHGDVHHLPFASGSFDVAILHLILAVVPDPVRCLGEIQRVVRPGGQVLIFDKFLRPQQHAPLRRLVNPLSRRLATRLDVVFEEVLAAHDHLQLESDQAALAGGWFRQIRLRRR